MRTATVLLAVVILFVAAPAWAADLPKDFRVLAEQGDADVQFNLGMLTTQ